MGENERGVTRKRSIRVIVIRAKLSYEPNQSQLELISFNYRVKLAQV
jgi:hypothetical protein